MTFRPDPKPTPSPKRYKRDALKRKIAIGRKYPEPPVNAVQLSMTKLALNKRKKTPNKTADAFYSSQWELFNDFYYGIPKDQRVCYECGVYIGEPFPASACHHILAKGRYPLLKYRIENLALVCDHHHDLYHFGTREQKAASRLYSNKELIDSLKELDKLLAKNR